MRRLFAGRHTSLGSSQGNNTAGLTTVDLPLRRLRAGKVREVFELDAAHLLMVATDRISAYDVVMAQGIPNKGRLLTGMSLFWFDRYRELCPNHLVSHAVGDLPDSIDAETTQNLAGRFMVIRKLEMLEIEFVIRGYLVGSGWKDYQRTGSVCGIGLPKGMLEAQQLPEPIFTPATKATSGHDENITEEQAATVVGADRLNQAKEYSLRLYEQAAQYARSRGIILADTKFEFGIADGEVVIADEVLTPDSSRFWPADQYETGSNPPSFDKQFLRDWLDAQGWDRRPPPPDLSPEVIEGTSSKYAEAYERLTGQSFQDYLASAGGAEAEPGGPGSGSPTGSAPKDSGTA